MEGIKRIVICSDFLMAKEKEQFSNRRWLIDILKRPIYLATQIKVTSFFSSLNDEERISRKTFFELSGIELDIDETQFWYDFSKINSKSLDYVKKYLCEEDLVIGYELSEQTRNVLNAIGVKYIDIWLHPVRFYDDILFAFNSNVDGIRGQLKNYHVSEENFYLYGARLKVQGYKGWDKSPLSIEENSALFVGQTLNDKAIKRNGKNLSILDFKDQIESACKKYNVVYYSRHPYVKRGDEEILKYVASNPKMKLIDCPAYLALMSGKIKEVLSISSSVAIEAKYFDVKSTILFKPIVGFYPKDRSGYYSLCQSFVNPVFWKNILGPVMKTQDCESVEFFDKKDKIRDMLAFYWSYKEIDKVERIRIDLKNKINQKAASTKVKKSGDQTVEVNSESLHIVGDKLSAVKKKIDKSTIVSFDIFDTLVERPFQNPSDLFDYLEKFGDVKGVAKFAEERRNVRTSIIKSLNFDKNKEISILDRYKFINEEAASYLAEQEANVDKTLISRKEIGFELYKYAVSKGKTIIYTSDTYYGETTIREILEKCGYDSDNRMFLSSAFKDLKATGVLFEKVIKEMNVDPSKILHIGDNKAVDIDKAGEKSIKTSWVPSSIDRLRSESLISSPDSNGDKLFTSIYLGLSGQKWPGAKNGIQSFTAGDKNYFGYAILGPMFLGFAKWVLEKAISDKIDRLYFLARDGEIVKRTVDAISGCYKVNVPKTHYLLASRRSYNIASIKTGEDIENILKVNFSPISLKELFKDRFGVDVENTDLEGETWISDVNEKVSFRQQLPLIIAFALKISPRIFENSQKEREQLLDYFRKKDLFEEGNIAVVDIGHQGSLQKSLMNLLENQEVRGYYFSTFEGIKNNIKKNYYDSFYQKEISPRDKTNDYMSHILMFETMFLNASTSFVCFRNNEPTFLETKELGRIEFITDVHNSAIEFCKDFCSVLGSNIQQVNISGEVAANPYNRFLKNPQPVDVLMFKKVEFENKYSGRGLVSILNPAASIWAEGANYFVENDSVIRGMIYKYVMAHESERKIKKFIASPKSYLEDSSNVFVRALSLFY